ncbi:MAG: hypothetical protein FWG98_12455 [Candidatus Cloacimonetes bacterium]|nr:hypothetical protein [Candidatus Cloacimonadota bacterium]
MKSNDMSQTLLNIQKKSTKKKMIMFGLITFCVFFVAFFSFIVLNIYAVCPSSERHWANTYRDSIGFGIESERITLKTDDNIALAAWRTRAENSIGTVIIVSGRQTPSVTLFFGYAKMFSDYGWDSLLIEKRGRNLSEGDEIGFGMTEWLDVKAGVDYLSSDEIMRDLPIIAMGTIFSDAVIIAAGEVERIDAVISITSPASFIDILSDYANYSKVPHFIQYFNPFIAKMVIGFRFGFDAWDYTPINGITKLGDRPILLMHSTEDILVPISQFEKLYQKALENDIDVKTFVREGNYFFVCDNEHILEPTLDVEFSQTILNFLDNVKINFYQQYHVRMD